mmetsp:Transcript_2498/g.4673  ORF Transcript_2498/g.4673 Transcript_2498/m.4673 type:complete len:416 (+) Transcript_2498:112-1359(+)
MSDTGDDSSSWMDASIRLHMRQFCSSPSGSQASVDENDFIDDIIAPPIAIDSEHVIVAELVREIAANSTDEGRLKDDINSKQDTSSTSQVSPSPCLIERKVESFGKEKYDDRCTRKKAKQSRTSSCFSEFIISRTSLPYSIDHNEMTFEWTAVIHTNQEAMDKNDLDAMEEKIVSMTFCSLEESREACHAYAPPRMHSFEDSSKCNICKRAFHKLIRRPCHCRNCGVCVCSACSLLWPRSMLPVTYRANRTRRKKHRVCMACDWLSGAFRQALLAGNVDRAVALHATGNINTRCPFANVRGDHYYYPVHCAVLGGNLSMLKWLVESLYCPITAAKQSPPKLLQPKNMNIVLDQHVLSSQGKTVLDLAMEAQELGILYYLIFERGISVMQCRNLPVALRAFEAALRHLPDRLKEAL